MQSSKESRKWQKRDTNCKYYWAYLHKSVLVAAAAAWLFCTCKNKHQIQQNRRGQQQEPERPGPQIEAVCKVVLTTVPDVAIPKSEVKFVASVSPIDLKITSLQFHLLSDPCGGKLSQKNKTAVYLVPADCTKGEVEVEVELKAENCTARDHAKVRVREKGSALGALLLYPKRIDNVDSPIHPVWDAVTYRRYGEKLIMKVTRRNVTILETEPISPDSIIELDVPPSPEITFLYVTTTGGRQESYRLTVYNRSIPEPEESCLIIDDFTDPSRNSVGYSRKTFGGKRYSALRSATIVSAEKKRPFLVFYYHVTDKNRELGFKEFLDGPGKYHGIDLTGYSHLSLWLRADPSRPPVRKVRVRLTGRNGWHKEFQLRRIARKWNRYDFSLYRIKVRHLVPTLVSIYFYVTSRLVSPPIGYIALGAIALCNPSNPK